MSLLKPQIQDFLKMNKKGGPSWTPWNRLSRTYAKPHELLEAIKPPKFGQISKLQKNNNEYNGVQVPTIVVPLFYLSILGYNKPLSAILPYSNLSYFTPSYYWLF